MTNFNLISYLSSNIKIDESEIEKMVVNCEKISVKKGTFLIQKGDVCRHSFFVESGLLRQYSIDKKGKEHIIQFAPENWFMTDRESVYFKQPSQYFIQAQEISNILLIDENFINQLSKKYPSFIAFNNMLLHNHIRNLQKRINQLLSATAEERYLDFIKVYPNLLLRVPQTMIASYLGITPESLSRVRKELALKNYKR
jgi:CRP-like cAMP-binding protein